MELLSVGQIVIILAGQLALAQRSESQHNARSWGIPKYDNVDWNTWETQTESHVNWMFSSYVQSSLAKPFNSRKQFQMMLFFFPDEFQEANFFSSAEIVAAHTTSTVNVGKRIHQHNCKTEAMPGRTEIYNKHNLSQVVSENPNIFHPDSRNIFFLSCFVGCFQLGVVLSNEKKVTAATRSNKTLNLKNNKTKKKQNRVE